MSRTRVIDSTRITTLAMALALTLSALTLAPAFAAAQVRRSASPDGAAPGPGAPRGMPRSARHPYAGVWQGVFDLTAPGGEKPRIPVVMVFNVADSAKSTYSGFTILPNGARAPHLATTVTKGEMQWKQENSGGGFWVYTGRFVTPDSVAGTVALRDWPQLPVGEKPPTGTFALARRPPGA